MASFRDIRRFSLLTPDEGAKYFDISGNTANDLSVDMIAESISKNTTEKGAIKKILLAMPVEEDVISYRREIYNELRDNEELCEQLYYIFDGMRFYTQDKPMSVGGNSTVWELLTHLRSLENYSISVMKLKEAIGDIQFKSRGLNRFAEYVNEIYSSSGFDEFMEDVKIVSEELTKVRSLTLGVNLNRDYYPEEVGIISLNSYWFDEQSVLKNFMKFHRNDRINYDKDLMPFSMEMHYDSGKIFRNFALIQAIGNAMNTSQDGVVQLQNTVNRAAASQTAPESPLMQNLNSIIEKMLPSITQKLRKTVDKYMDVSGRALAQLADEMLFYLRFAELERQIKASGMPTCMGENSADDTVFHDIYNVKLAILRIQGSIKDDIICNDVDFTKEKTVQILTGPNRGGKTVITQAIGLAFLLYQSGVFVPAAEAHIRACDGIYTHFPVEEERTVTLGRLGEEAERFNRICKTAGGDSLILFNESFATTSHAESLYIAEDVLKYLCCIGSRTIFNTHMHELAEEADKFGQTEGAVCGAVSVVMENENGIRSYKISYKRPDGKSYAHEIAYKYGITFEQLKEKRST